MKILKYIFITVFVVSCSSDNSNEIDINDDNTILSNAISNRIFEIGSVIACAANDSLNTDTVKVYFYPEEGSTNFTLYETDFTDLNPNEFSNYKAVESVINPLFDGTLREYSRVTTIEKWFIVTYELDNEIKISNPIRSKNVSQVTVVSSSVLINQDVLAMPIFTWNANFATNNAIYFQVLSTIGNNFLSGTYTFENQFQYYNTSNVVLNITDGIPPSLISGEYYNFLLMDVSEDNWVNEIINTSFLID